MPRNLIGLSLLLVGMLGKVAAAQYTTGTAGGAAAHDNMQPSLALNYVVRVDGTFDELGEVGLFAGNFAPRSWSLASGQLLPIANHQALFSKLGTTYGGDGETTFALPDLRGRVPVHAGQGAGLSSWQLGERRGEFEQVLTDGQVPAHSHELPGGDMTSPFGGGQPHNNIQPSLGLNYGIATVGIFPSRNAALPHGDEVIAAGTLGEPFIAEIRLNASSDLRANFTPTNGQTLQIASNTALFSLAGCTYGGDCRTTFDLPNLEGRAVIHAGNGNGLSSRSLGEAVGVEEVVLSVDQLPAHNHSIDPLPGVTSDVGGGQAHPNMQPSLALNYMIALTGLFPSRNAATGAEANADDVSAAGGGTEPLIGELSLFAGNFAPRGWALADGQLLPIAQNQALFSILGTTFGGDGRTTFALPDLRGRLAIGAGQGPGLPDFRLGQVLGTETALLASNQMPSHAHAFVPEPGSAALLSAAAVVLIGLRRRES